MFPLLARGAKDPVRGAPYLFVQRRAAGKDTWPNKLHMTVGGHLGAGESTLDGLREVEEELGLTLTAGELLALGTRKAEKRIPAGLDREFQEVLLLVRSLSPEGLRLQEEEVAAVARLRLDDIEALYEGAGIFGEVGGWENIPREDKFRRLRPRGGQLSTASGPRCPHGFG